MLDGEEISIENPKFVIKKDSTGGHAEYSSLVFRYNSDPWNEDTDGDGLDDDSDFDPIHPATDDQLKIIDFLIQLNFLKYSIWHNFVKDSNAPQLLR